MISGQGRLPAAGPGEMADQRPRPAFRGGGEHQRRDVVALLQQLGDRLDRIALA